jgi:hypothetical protein
VTGHRSTAELAMRELAGISGFVPGLQLCHNFDEEVVAPLGAGSLSYGVCPVSGTRLLLEVATTPSALWEQYG